MKRSRGYRFEATQAVRQVLNRAVVWGMLDVNPAKVGVDNPIPRRKEQHPSRPGQSSKQSLPRSARAMGR
jgi:hypothetical protein